MEYFDGIVDQIELSKKLKFLKHRSFASENRKSETPEQLIRMLIKHARRNSFEILRKLAADNNPPLLKVFDHYRANKDIEHFTDGI